MAEASATLHEAVEHLTPATRDMHRALVSLQEELEAVDWYQQRVDAAGDAELKDILRHNRDEEKEHAAMVLEWIRRHDPGWNAALRTYLFTTAPIVSIESPLGEEAGAAGNGRGRAPSVGLGSLRGAG